MRPEAYISFRNIWFSDHARRTPLTFVFVAASFDADAFKLDCRVAELRGLDDYERSGSDLSTTPPVRQTAAVYFVADTKRTRHVSLTPTRGECSETRIVRSRFKAQLFNGRTL